MSSAIPYTEIRCGLRPHTRARALVLECLAILSLLGAGGCVSRTLVIDSEPSGATIFLDGKRLGETPIETPFTWYGRREVMAYKAPPSLEELEADKLNPVRTLDEHSYRLHTFIDIVRPAHQTPGLDIASDLLYPGHIEDRQEFHLQLKAVPLLEGEEFDAADALLRARADELRQRAAAAAPEQ